MLRDLEVKLTVYGPDNFTSQLLMGRLYAEPNLQLCWESMQEGVGLYFDGNNHMQRQTGIIPLCERQNGGDVPETASVVVQARYTARM